ncbi:hypothetical protein PspLS_11498 [Pyricularia sp. CBS 133598]|nr:hypothetical protein PspLS_11498 [Pyricularia sp. CBS 133598]
MLHLAAMAEPSPKVILFILSKRADLLCYLMMDLVSFRIYQKRGKCINWSSWPMKLWWNKKMILAQVYLWGHCVMAKFSWTTVLMHRLKLQMEKSPLELPLGTDLLNVLKYSGNREEIYKISTEICPFVVLQKTARWIVSNTYRMHMQKGKNIQNKTGDTPLHETVSEGHLDCVQYLLESGADWAIRNRGNLTVAD